MNHSIRPELARRIVWEAEAIRSTFGDRVQLHLDENGQPAWIGSVPVEGMEFPVIVTYAPAHPAVPPTLETTIELPRGCPHILGRHQGRTELCWISPHAHGRRRWNPQRHTAATVLRAAQRWALAFVVWQALGTWPVPDAWDW